MELGAEKEMVAVVLPGTALMEMGAPGTVAEEVVDDAGAELLEQPVSRLHRSIETVTMPEMTTRARPARTAAGTRSG